MEQFTATGTYSDGSTHDLTSSVTWSSSVLDVATINRVGVATAFAVGQTTIEAALGAINGSATLNVVLRGGFVLTGSMSAPRIDHRVTLLNNGMVLMAGGLAPSGYLSSAELYEPATRTPPDLESIAITPERSTLSPGETQHFIATGTFSDGSTQELASVTWSSSDPTVAEISNDAGNHGVALAIGAGKVIIEARAGTGRHGAGSGEADRGIKTSQIRSWETGKVRNGTPTYRSRALFRLRESQVLVFTNHLCFNYLSCADKRSA